MPRAGGLVYPDFRFEDNPAMDKTPESEIGYPLGSVPVSDDVDYTFPGEPEEYPEMDFRKLANSLDDGHSIPNTSYLTHSIHKHPAIFIPHIPSYIIRQFTNSKNREGKRPVVLDPFSGSGTTGVEAKIHGRDYVGIEINPLSRLVSEVATTPIPPTILNNAKNQYNEILDSTESKTYADFDVEFLDNTTKEHWFEPEAIQGLTRIRKALDDFINSDNDLLQGLTEIEEKALQDNGITEDVIATRVHRWLTLLIANTVFDVSNADPGVSKAYRSQKMLDLIENGKHPPNVIETYQKHISESQGKLTKLWNEIYGTDFAGGTIQRTLERFDTGESSAGVSSLSDNHAHKATVDIRLDDARAFSLPEYTEEVDIAITSPPYINAMNYYRGSKLRLFWIYDFLEEDEKFDARTLRRSIIGSNSVSMGDVDRELPARLKDTWVGSEEEFNATRLPHLDEDINAIHKLDHNTAERKAYVTWKFFAEDMLQNLSRVYEHLKPGGYYFFVIGENTIGERLIQSHKYVADIAQNLGKFEGHGGDFSEDKGFRLVGSAWDSITNRDLFQDRRHEGGVIECEWVIILQKPK